MFGHVAQVGKEDDALLVTAQLGQRQIARDAVTLESTTHQLARAATAGIWTKTQDPQTLDDDGKAPAPGDSTARLQGKNLGAARGKRMGFVSPLYIKCILYWTAGGAVQSSLQ